MSETFNEPLDLDGNAVYAVFCHADHPLNLLRSCYGGDSLIDNRFGLAKRLKYLPGVVEDADALEEERQKHLRFYWVSSILFVLFNAAIGSLIPGITFTIETNGLYFLAFELMVAGESISFGFSLFKEVARKKDLIFANLSRLKYALDWSENERDRLPFFLEDLKRFAQSGKDICPPELKHSFYSFYKRKKGDSLQAAEERLLQTEKDNSFLANDSFLKDSLLEALAFASAVTAAVMSKLETPALIKALCLVFAVALLGVLVGYYLAHNRLRRIRGNYEWCFALVGYLNNDQTLLYSSSYVFPVDLSKASPEDRNALRERLAQAFSEPYQPRFLQDFTLTDSSLSLNFFSMDSKEKIEGKIKDVLVSFR